jgi:Flp pilus assembly protein TadD
VETILAITGTAVVVLSALGGFGVYVIRGEIAKATKPIQPEANGGKSLPDVAANTALIVERQTDIIRDIRSLRERLDDHIDNHHLKG